MKPWLKTPCGEANLFVLKKEKRPTCSIFMMIEQIVAALFAVPF